MRSSVHLRLLGALALVLTLLGGTFGSARPASANAADLFFSEYVEGSSNDKALEIYNGTGSAVDLAAANYVIQFSFNGGTSTASYALTGSVANDDVYVVAATNASATLAAFADQQFATAWFNGDDAVVLWRGGVGGTVVDVIGQVGFDPGTEWPGGGLDDTLRRLGSVCAGDTNPSDAFTFATEWETFAINTFGGLGSHTASCGAPTDTAPSVSSVTPASGASDVAVNTNITVTFSESVDVAAGAISVECPAGTLLASSAAASDVTSVTIDPASDLPALTGCAIVISPSGVADNDGAPDALAGTASFSFTTAAASPTITPIHAIQGSGSAVTGAGPFTVEAIVAGDYQTQGSGQLRGFFIQEEDADADADPATSEGIFVFCSACPTPVAVGDKVQVTGSASEFFDMSQLSATTAGSISVLSSGNPLPTPATVTLPVPGVPTGDLAAATAAINAYFEPFEGMLVTFPATLSVSEYFELARYGQVILTEGGRPRTFTDANAPSAAGLIDHEISLAGRTIILDDTDNRQNRPVDTPNTNYYHPVPGLSTANFFRGGDTISNLTGVLHWSFAGQTGTDAWRIRPVTEAFSYAFTPANPRPAAPAVGGSLKVASFNVLNYFLTIDTTSSSSSGACGASATLDCRGPDSAAERDQQQAKLTAALSGLDADVFGLIELENTPNVDPLGEIVADLNAVTGPGTYATIDTGVVGTDAIKVGLIYKPAAVTPVGAPFIDNDPIHNRPPVAQLFESADGARFTVIVNHFKSKGCTDATGADLDQLDGQGCYNAQRVAQAGALLTFIDTIKAQTADPDVLIIGDLNSYAKEDPITTLQNGGFTNLVAQFGGAGAYSYVFDGQLGYLDHALASASLLAQVTGTAEWHINADENPLFDYNDAVKDTGESTFEEESDTLPLYAPDAFRTSDHDPVVIGLGLTRPNSAPTAADDSAQATYLAPVTIAVLANDDDADNDTLTVSIVTPPSFGSAVANADGTITFTPGEQAQGTAITTSFTYQIDDGHGGAAGASVSVESVRLQLTSLCPSGSYRVRNPGSFPISYAWDVYGTGASGSGSAAPGDSTFTTGLDTGTVRLFVAGILHSTKATRPCTGTLTVTKVVSLDGLTPPAEQFTICITGPSYPGGDCRQIGTAGGSLVWNKLEPGTYRIQEQHPGDEWSTSYSTQQVTVTEGGSATATITNKLCCLYATKITLARQGSKINGTVTVTYSDGYKPSNVAVTVRWTRPNGTTVTQTARTGQGGVATFSLPRAGGTTTLTVINISDAPNGTTTFCPERGVTQKSLRT